MSAMKVAFVVACLVLVLTEAAKEKDNNSKQQQKTTSTTPRMTCKRMLGILKKVLEVMKACE